MNLRLWASEHVGALTALLSAVSLTLVFAAALQRIPKGLLPRVEFLLGAIPHLNAIFSVTAIVVILAGVRAIRRGNVRRHRALMATSFLLFSLFLALYLYRVALLGPSEFSGPAVVQTYVYFPFLFVHIVLAVLCIPFVFFALLSAGTRSIPEIYETGHARVGRIAATLWLISFSMGIGIYLLLYHIY
jgi:putative membrane protein